MFDWNSAMGYQIRDDIETMKRSKYVKERAVEAYKACWDRGLDPNDCTDMVFNTIGAFLDELTDDDREDMIAEVERYCNF